MGNEKGKKRKDLVCFCYSVSREEIVTAIKEGSTTLMEVRKTTNANTGCGGCGEDVKKLLHKHAPRQAKQKKGGK